MPTADLPVVGWSVVLLILVIALVIPVALLVLPLAASRLTGTNQPGAAKLAEYECGFPAFDVRFYLVAILFVSGRCRRLVRENMPVAGSAAMPGLSSSRHAGDMTASSG